MNSRVMVGTVLLFITASAQPVRADAPRAPNGAEFFETQVQPILQAHCFSCHGDQKKVKGGLRLSSRETLLQGGQSGSVVSLDQPEKSLLLQAIQYQDLKMPPRGKLPQAQIDVLSRWVKMGVPWSASAGRAVRRGAPPVDEQARQFWSFRPVVRPAAPVVQNPSWVATPIDAFVLARLEAAGLRPARPAEKGALLRRLYYDLIGLPPTPEEVAAFVADPSPAAYEQAVDRLLASPHYGEHWGRHWLDLVRYAETNSFERDGPKPNVWRYRDYVIQSFNADKPYDQFIREQLAGDELPRATAESIIATGYYRLGQWDDEPVDREQTYYDGLDDIVATTGQVFLGLTVGCARCHDHKIDPFPQKDYYRLLAFFHGVRHYAPGAATQRSVAVADEKTTPAERAKQAAAIAAHKKQLTSLKRQITEIENKVIPFLQGGERDDFKFALNRPSLVQKHAKELGREVYDQYDKLQQLHLAISRNRPPGPSEALCVTEMSPRETFVLLRGNPQAKGDRVEPGFPSVLPERPREICWPVPGSNSSGRRRTLAEWIANPANPLTARVMVNRIWQYHFGRGLVRSSSNFGFMGTPPTHPELLDWLASEFVTSGWHWKPLHKLMVMSNTYRMSSNAERGTRNAESDANISTRRASEESPSLARRVEMPNNPQSVDAENDLFWHFDLRRLSAEEIRDSILFVSGNLHRTVMGGPSIFPVIPAEVLAGQSRPGDGWHTSPSQERNRRSVYIHVKRSLAVPILAAFDVAETDASCPVRFTTTQPTQALGMLNSAFLNEQARTFAADLCRQCGGDPAAQVRRALQQTLQREPKPAEVQRGVEFMQRLCEEHDFDSDEALQSFCLMALNLNGFLYVD